MIRTPDCVVQMLWHAMGEVDPDALRRSAFQVAGLPDLTLVAVLQTLAVWVAHAIEDGYGVGSPTTARLISALVENGVYHVPGQLL